MKIKNNGPESLTRCDYFNQAALHSVSAHLLIISFFSAIQTSYLKASTC